jgi:hypothetical protein
VGHGVSTKIYKVYKSWNVISKMISGMKGMFYILILQDQN